ncbi:UbiX family flavin prenyltransferase [Pendulispora brunnea]|uniref:Flavin prenyltransferase UbiX n=1 Tax=Pendulispora brunnea TaxID=2905690 RepID=A0ABZ2K546_9BACT
MKIVVGITGASGAPYAKRLLSVLAERRRVDPALELGLCLSPTAPEVWALECGGDLRQQLREQMGDIPLWGQRDYRAPFASGSAGWDAMVIVPCSMGTAARIAHGISDSLLTRAADVMLKERRKLVLVPRETPLSVIHLENLTTLARAGATILPAMPSFYSNPRSMDDVVDSVVSRILDHVGIGNDLMRRWGTT